MEGTETYNLLLTVKKEIAEAKKAAITLVKDFGGLSYKQHVGVLAGGIFSVKFKTKIDGWRGAQEANFYRPKSTNISAIQRISELPVVEISRLNDVLKFKSQYVTFDGAMQQVNYPDMFFRKGYCLLAVPSGTEYPDAPADLVEILDSEFFTLYNQYDDQIGI